MPNTLPDSPIWAGLPHLHHTKSFLKNGSVDGFIISTSTPASPDMINLAENQEQTSLLIITFINAACIVVFIPLNLKLMNGFRKISTKDQPMFLFFVAVQCVCVGDLAICLVDTAFIWRKANDWTCRILGGLYLSQFMSLSLLLVLICLYRYVTPHRSRSTNTAKRKRYFHTQSIVFICCHSPGTVERVSHYSFEFS